MNRMTASFTRIYASLLRLYPRSFRESFEDDMLLDFSQMAVDAAAHGAISLLWFLFCEARDLPASALRLHLKEGRMSRLLGSGSVRGALHAAAAFGLAFAAMMTAESLFVTAMNGQGWLLLLRMAHSLDLLLNYNAAAQTILYTCGLVLGALCAGAILAAAFADLRRIRIYILAALACWAVPMVLIRTGGVLLRANLEGLGGKVFLIVFQLVIGLGFGFLFMWISGQRRQMAWLLAAGVLSFYAASTLIRLLVPFMPLSNTAVMGWSWADFGVSVFLMAIEGALTGAALGAIARPPQDILPAAV